jgi:hypothetical protein
MGNINNTVFICTEHDEDIDKLKDACLEYIEVNGLTEFKALVKVIPALVNQEATFIIAGCGSKTSRDMHDDHMGLIAFARNHCEVNNMTCTIHISNESCAGSKTYERKIGI